MLREIAVGIGLGFAFFTPFACVGGGLSPLVRCKLDALRVLPEDPGQATLNDAIDVIERLRACHRAADGGP